LPLPRRGVLGRPASGYGLQGSEVGVYGLWFMVYGLWFIVSVLGIRISGFVTGLENSGVIPEFLEIRICV